MLSVLRGYIRALTRAYLERKIQEKHEFGDWYIVMLRQIFWSNFQEKFVKLSRALSAEGHDGLVPGYSKSGCWI